MAVASETTRVCVPTEIIIHEILVKLPANSLLRFKCVSKFYNAVISSPEFIDLHLRHSLSFDSSRLLILAAKYSNSVYSLDVDSLDPASTFLRIPLPVAIDDSAVSILGSLHGLLCIGIPCVMTPYIEVALINPSTRVYRLIPLSNSTPRQKECLRQSFGFGFDDVIRDYKLVRVAVYQVLGLGAYIQNMEVTVYSLNESAWISVEDVDDPTDLLFGHLNGVLMKNSLLHWVFWGPTGYHIHCFDVRSDNWVTEVPLLDSFTLEMFLSDEDNNTMVIPDLILGVFHECLCVSLISNSCEVVWMMKECGVKASWVKLFDISRAADYLRCFVPFGFRKGSKHEVLVVQEHDDEEDRLFWYDTRPKTNGRTEEIQGVLDFHEACFFKASLVPIPNGLRIEQSTNQLEIVLD